MKFMSADEVARNTDDAGPMELACATNEFMAAAVRLAVIKGDIVSCKNALEVLAGNVAMMQKWITELKNMGRA